MRLFKARLAWLCGILLVVLGALPVLYAAGLVTWQFADRVLGAPPIRLSIGTLFTHHAYPFLPALPPEWLLAWTGSPGPLQVLGKVLSGVHVAWLFALPGVLLAALGVWMVFRQAVAIEAEKRRRADRLRRLRVGQYSGAERVEPFLGPGAVAAPPERDREAA